MPKTVSVYPAVSVMIPVRHLLLMGAVVFRAVHDYIRDRCDLGVACRPCGRAGVFRAVQIAAYFRLLDWNDAFDGSGGRTVPPIREVWRLPEWHSWPIALRIPAVLQAVNILRSCHSTSLPIAPKRVPRRR